MSKVDFVWKWLTRGCVKSKEEPNPALGDTSHDEENGYEVKRLQYTVKSREKPVSFFFQFYYLTVLLFFLPIWLLE